MDAESEPVIAFWKYLKSWQRKKNTSIIPTLPLKNGRECTKSEHVQGPFDLFSGHCFDRSIGGAEGSGGNDQDSQGGNTLWEAALMYGLIQAKPLGHN